MKFYIICLLSLVPGIFITRAKDFNYSGGILIINEDWYGHQNSSINYLDYENAEGEYWHYRIIREENPGMELGCTNQFASFWNGKLYCIAKQDKDPGASITGGRITVCDSKTMKILHQQSLIDPSGAQCDGRAFVGVNDHKGYVSSSNGIWIFNLDTNEIEGMVKGSGNPYAGAGNDKPNTDPTGSLYFGQSGTMILAANKVFAAHQQYGLLIIDPSKDEVIKTLSMDIVEQGAGIGSLVKSKDGNIWISIAKDTKGLGNALNYLLKLNPETLEYEVKKLPDDIYGPLNSWYAWTPDAFTASSKQNSIYWKGGKNSWFSGVWIFKYDIDKDDYSLFINLEDDPEDWKLYGCSIGIDPQTDEIFMSLYHQFGKPEYTTRRYSPEGDIIKDYPMIENYWFPSVILFPESEIMNAEVQSVDKVNPVIFVKEKTIFINNAENEIFRLYSLNGILISEFQSDSKYFSKEMFLNPGMYILKGKNITKKLLIK